MSETTRQELDTIAEAAVQAFRLTRAADDATRSGWLHAVADALDARADELVAIADHETHLGEARLRGEVARTTGQLRLFAAVIEEGSYLEATIDHAVPDASPPRPDLRRILVPLGPVAVYSASNFPFAFSVAGGDTASALAVGCTVIVKAHPGHPQLSRRTAELVEAALAQAGAPAGTFALVEGYDAGIWLVDHPAIAAASFTGSLSGGRALFDRAAARPTPIPFYGELSSINPVVVTPAADAARGAELAEGLAGSFQLGAGQFCTKPGLVFAPKASVLEAAVASHVGGLPVTMLSDPIADRFRAGAARIGSIPGVERIAGPDGAQGSHVSPLVFATSIGTLRSHGTELFEEVFGPTTVLVRYDSVDQVGEALAGLDGSLTATIHAEAGEDIGALVRVATERVGRVLFAGWPTGVAVSWAQQHGGPYPSTTSVHTSVGATAVRRFQRPVTFQSAPPDVLPQVLRDAPTRSVPRRIDGVLKW